MTAVNTDGTLYTAQEANDPDGVAVYQQFTQGTNYFSGPATVLFSQCLAMTAGGTGDTRSFMKLPKGTVILGGWLFLEDGLQADNKLCNLGVIYEGGETGTTDNDECLLANLDCFDGATGLISVNAALPTGSWWPIGQDTTTVPYVVTGGVGTVMLTTEDALVVTSKDLKLMLIVILPGV